MWNNIVDKFLTVCYSKTRENDETGRIQRRKSGGYNLICIANPGARAAVQ